MLGSAAFAAVPATPLGVAMTANAADSVTLSWYRAAGNDATGWTVYAGESAEGKFEKVGQTAERSFTHRGLKSGTTWYYKVAASNADGESEPAKPAQGFTIKPIEPTPFPVKVAENMCLSLNATVLCDPKPVKGKLEALVDGRDATDVRLNDTCEIKIKLNDAPADAAYLMVHFRTGHGPYDFANDPMARILKAYVISESLDSADGKDGTWTEVAQGTNTFLDGVIVIPNHKPKWISVKNIGKRELILCRLDIFRAAPAGQRNDSWVFTGDSLIAQDMPGGSIEGRTAWFSDEVRKMFPNRYPIVLNNSRGGEMLKDTMGRMKNALPILNPKNGTDVPTGTIVVWETGFNDVGIGGGLWMGEKIIKQLADAQEFCKSQGLLMVPVRIEYSTGYLDKETLEPTKYNVFYNTLAVNLAGVDVFCRANTPYACDPKTQMPYADYWTYTRENHATALGKDGVHHTKAGSDGINRLWADVAGRMVYGQPPAATQPK
jgi:hypothetical protein